MKKLLFFFIDGLGLSESSDNNPVTEFLKPITGVDFLQKNSPLKGDNILLTSIDPILGIKGIPQSATGQTSIMTGVNSQEVLGHHLTAFPNEKLINLLKERNLLSDLKKRGVKTTCANMYSREFFERRSQRVKNMFPVSALSIKFSHIPFRFIDDYHRGEAVFADITNELIIKRGYKIDPITPEEAGVRVMNIFNEFDFIFFEYFISDSYGHKRLGDELKKEVEKLNRFISFLNCQPGIDIVITSDHGNCEDISTGNHTKNPVPLIYISEEPDSPEDFFRVKDLTGIRDFILSLF